LKEIFVKKTISTMIALTLVASAGLAQQKPAAGAAPAAGATAAQADPIVIAAGDLSIRQTEFESALKSLPAEYQQYATGPGKRQFAEDYLRMKMLAAEGVKSGLDKDPEVQAQLALMKENLVAQAQLTRIEKGITVTDEDLKKKYDENKTTYEQVKARHILIAFKGSPAAQEGKTELTEEQAKAKAEDLRKQIVGGASFDELAKKESDDVGSGARGGDLGAFGRGQMVPEFETAAFGAKPGDLTPVVRTQFGYHIIKVEEHQMTPFEQVKPTLEKAERQTRMQAQLEQMKTNAKVTLNDAYFGPAVAPAPTPEPPAVQPASTDSKKQ
jgi:peptidyl-prolyl cis-trans isomerase C